MEQLDLLGAIAEEELEAPVAVPEVPQEPTEEPTEVTTIKPQTGEATMSDATAQFLELTDEEFEKLQKQREEKKKESQKGEKIKTITASLATASFYELEKVEFLIKNKYKLHRLQDEPNRSNGSEVVPTESQILDYLTSTGEAKKAAEIYSHFGVTSDSGTGKISRTLKAMVTGDNPKLVKGGKGTTGTTYKAV